MIDPTQTQPLPWRMHPVPGKPWEESPMETRNRQAPTLESPPPERLSDRGYRLRARLGSGRLGAIYEAQDDLSRSSGSQHFVAIQLIDEKIASRPGFAAVFERGAQELRSLAHPNIVKLLEYGRDRDRLYLVNELLESASVRFVLQDVAELPLEEASAVLRAVGDALQYLHAKSIVHGNVNPGNVLVTFGYEVKLLDIVPTGWIENPPDELGVPARQPDKRDDVFGLACLAYEMLAGRHPFNGNTAQEAYRAGLEAAPITTLSPRQWHALEHALSVHRDDRTPSVAQFLDEFGVSGIERLRTIVSASIEAPPEIAPAPVTRPPPHALVAERASPSEPERTGIAGKLFFLLALVALGAVAWIYQDPLREQSASLIAAVEAQFQDSGAPVPSATKPATVDAPLPQVATVTDPAPALVLAPGATAPATTNTTVEPAVGPKPEASAPAATESPVSTATPEPVVAAPATMEAASPAPAAVAPAVSTGPARFSFGQSAATVRENEVAARIVIRRSGNTGSSAAIAWWTGDGTAKADSDYADLGARVERFEPGELSRTIYIPLTNDAFPESTKNFNVFLGNGEAAQDAPPLSGMRVDIVDDD
jgi:protein kinase-like protein/Calx-beta domain-containing protein